MMRVAPRILAALEGSHNELVDVEEGRLGPHSSLRDRVDLELPETMNHIGG